MVRLSPYSTKDSHVHCGDGTSSDLLNTHKTAGLNPRFTAPQPYALSVLFLLLKIIKTGLKGYIEPTEQILCKPSFS